MRTRFIVIAAVLIAILTTTGVVALVLFQKPPLKPPGIPQSLQAIGDIWQVTIQWSEVTDATSYIIYWSTTPGLTKTSGTKIQVSNSPFVHQNLENDIAYYYLIAAVGPGGESNASQVVSATTRLPKITGTPTLPSLNITYTNKLPGGGLYGVFLCNLTYDPIANDTDADPSYSFSVKPNKAYILSALYNGGQVISAVTPTITGDLVQNITLDTEVAMNILVATEQAMNSLEPASLSRPLDDLLADANQEVSCLNAFYRDRNGNRSADRIADAVHALTLDKLNQGDSVNIKDLNEDIIRAYGGGLQGIRPLSDMISNPKTPFNPQFTFTRYNSQKEVDFGMSDLETKRWDYLGLGMCPHITTGGTSVVYCGKTSTLLNATQCVLGVYKKTLGSTADPILLTQTDVDCLMASWSHDETKIAFIARYVEPDADTQPYNLFVMDADGSNRIRLTNYTKPLVRADLWSMQGAGFPSWSPNGSEIIFSMQLILGESDGEIYYVQSLQKINANGTNQRSFFSGGATGYSSMECPSWSPDGSRIVFNAVPPGENDSEIIVASNDFKPGDNVTILTQNNDSDTSPAWSYDGRFIIFSSNRERELGTLPGVTYLQPFYVINSYTGKVVADFGDFTDAGFYFVPRFTAIEAVFKAVEGAQTDEYGNVIIDPGSDARCVDSPSSYNYYREIIPAANDLGIDFGCTDWFG